MTFTNPVHYVLLELRTGPMKHVTNVDHR